MSFKARVSANYALPCRIRFILTVSNDDTKDRFYDQLAAVVQTVPPHDQLVILGDMNAESGTDDVGGNSRWTIRLWYIE